MKRSATAVGGLLMSLAFMLSGCDSSSNRANNIPATPPPNNPGPANRDTAKQEAAAADNGASSASAAEKENGAATSQSVGKEKNSGADAEPVTVTFDDLNLNMQADIVYRPWMLTDRAKELDGRRIRVTGVMLGAGVSQQKNLKDFVLLKNKECKFGPGGQADHLLHVFYRGEKPANFTQASIEIEGVLKINPYQGPDGNTWSVYDLDATNYKELRR